MEWVYEDVNSSWALKDGENLDKVDKEGYVERGQEMWKGISLAWLGTWDTRLGK